RRVDFRHRDFGRAVAQVNDLEIEVGLQLVLVEPGLVQVDALVVEERGAEGAVAVGRFADPFASREREEDRVNAGGYLAIGRHTAVNAAAEPAGALDEVSSARDDWVEQASDLFRGVFVVARDDDDDVEFALVGPAEARTQSGADDDGA